MQLPAQAGQEAEPGYFSVCYPSLLTPISLLFSVSKPWSRPHTYLGYIILCAVPLHVPMGHPYLEGNTQNVKLKGTVPRDFWLQVFFMNQFPQAPEYPNRADSNIFKNVRRYFQLKVHHHLCRCPHWHMEKIFNQKSFPSSSSSLMLFQLFATGVVDIGGKFTDGVINTGGGALWLVNIPAILQKKSKWPKCYFQGLGGRWFTKKTWRCSWFSCCSSTIVLWNNNKNLLQ